LFPLFLKNYGLIDQSKPILAGISRKASHLGSIGPFYLGACRFFAKNTLKEVQQLLQTLSNGIDKCQIFDPGR
jgi:hypothetical protein